MSEEKFTVDCSALSDSLATSFKNSKPWLIKNFLLLGLTAALIIGLAVPAPGALLSNIKWQGFRVVQTINVVIIFFISGLSLKTDEITAALKAWGPLLYGFVMILFVTPLAGMSRSPKRE